MPTMRMAPLRHPNESGVGPARALLMSEISGNPDPANLPSGPIDVSRVRSFIGLSIGLVGPRANLAVSGVLVTLYVQHRASGALAVTFALTANRLLSWVTYPVAGRLSDRTRSRIGRRTPYMAASLIVLGISTWMFTVVSGYWLLVLFIVVARQAAAVFTLANVAVVPEVFGRSRWLKALLLTTALGTVASLAIKTTVLTTWKQNDPSTWNLPFQVAAVIMVGVGLVVLMLVREAPAADFGADADRTSRARPVRDELRDILAGPNAKVLVAGSLLFWSGIGSTAYVAVLYFQRVLHAGAGAQTIAGLATGIPVFFIGIGLGIPVSRIMSRRQLAIGAPLIGGMLAGVQYFDTHIWQAVVLSYIGAPFIGAYLIVLAPMLLQLLPRSGGLGERLGVLLSPFNLVGVALAYLAATVVDATGNYRLVWMFPAATGISHALVNCWLKFPPIRASRPDMISQLWKWSLEQGEAVAEQGFVAGLFAAPLLGVVTKEDADSAVIVDIARKILGNPYEEDPRDPASEPEVGSDRGETGVTQVGGGPTGGDRWGDQKSGTGTGADSGSEAVGTEAGSRVADTIAGSGDTGGVTGVSAGEAGVPAGEAGVPVGGVAPRRSSAGPGDEPWSTDSGPVEGTEPSPDGVAEPG
jgi:maltose/moltooligosaccharide transporter